MSYGIQFLLICALVVLGCAKVTVQGSASRRFINNTSDSVLFNAELFLVIAIVMLVLFNQNSVGVTGLWLAAIAGIGTFLFQTCYALGLKSGPVSLTVLLVNFSVLFVTAFSVIAYHEHVYLTQLFGILLLVASMLLSVKREQSGNGISGKWLALTLVAMAASAASTIVMKIYARDIGAGIENSENTFVVLEYVFAAACAFAYYFVTTLTKKSEKSTCGFFNLKMLIYVLIIGVVLGIYQRFYMIGLEKVDGTFMFPTYAGMQSLGMTLIGIILFRDKLSKRQMIGVACGIACVVLMNVRLVELF